MSELRKATMADAKAAWDAYPEDDRSIRKVVAAMREAGIECPVATLQRWAKAGFAVKEDPRGRMARAAKTVSEKTQEHEGKALTRLEVIEREEAAMKERHKALMQEAINLSQLKDTANRELLAAQILLAEQISRRAAIIVEVAPEIAAKILAVLTEATTSTTIVIPPDEAPNAAPNGDGAKVVEGRVLEKSPSQIAIEAFKARQRVGVAA